MTGVGSSLAGSNNSGPSFFVDSLDDRRDRCYMYTMKKNYGVRCPACSEEHNVKSVEFLGVSSDLYGRDVMEFTCPATGERADALVYEGGN